jgi:hypothetical protein
VSKRQDKPAPAAALEPADAALVELCRDSAVGRAYGVHRVEVTPSGLGIRIHLGRRGT